MRKAVELRRMRIMQEVVLQNTKKAIAKKKEEDAAKSYKEYQEVLTLGLNRILERMRLLEEESRLVVF